MSLNRNLFSCCLLDVPHFNNILDNKINIMPSVYIINKSGHDYSSARKYGKLVYLTEGLIVPDKITLHYRILAEKMRGAKPGDYILVTSIASINCIAGWIIGTLGFPLNLLIYNNKHRKYLEWKIFPELTFLKEEKV